MNVVIENNVEIWMFLEFVFNVMDEMLSLVDFCVLRYCVFVFIFLFSVIGNILVIFIVVLL